MLNGDDEIIILKFYKIRVNSPNMSVISLMAELL